MPERSDMPYWRLSGFYFFHFSVLGILVPYWSLYLKSVGFSAVDIGSLMAILMASRIVAPNVWGYMADHRRERMRVVRWAALLTVISFCGVFAGTSFWWLAAVMLTFSFFWNASLPVIETQVMHHTRHHPGRYGQVRLWGSVGFIVAVVALGPVIDRVGPAFILPVMALLMAGIFLSSFVLPEAEFAGPMNRAEPFLKTMAKPEILAFLTACFLMAMSHGPYYTFFSILLEGHGHTKSVIGVLWAYAVVCEILVFLAMPRILARVSLRQVLLWSFALAAIRWWVIATFPDSMAGLVVAQTLHAATFGSFHAAGIQMVFRFFTGHHQHRGQAAYGTVGFGMGGAMGAFYSGHAWDTAGPAITYGIAAGCALAAWLVAWRWLKPDAAEARGGAT